MICILSSVSIILLTDIEYSIRYSKSHASFCPLLLKCNNQESILHNSSHWFVRYIGRSPTCYEQSIFWQCTNLQYINSLFFPLFFLIVHGLMTVYTQTENQSVENCNLVSKMSLFQYLYKS